MRNGWRSRPIYIQLLMYAMAVQAMTPDANDLASCTLFKTLGLATDWNRTACDADALHSEAAHDAGDTSPLDGDLPDGLPDDEVAPPGGCLAGQFRLQRQGGSNEPSSHTADRASRCARLRQRCAPRLRANSVRPTGLIAALGRLTC